MRGLRWESGGEDVDGMDSFSSGQALPVVKINSARYFTLMTYMFVTKYVL